MIGYCRVILSYSRLVLWGWYSLVSMELLVRDLVEARLRDKLAASHVEVVDESHLHVGHAGAKSGGGHFRAVIVSEKFEGLSRVKSQQLVYRAMGAWMGNEIHALSMQTLTPAEWDALERGREDRGT